MNRKLANCVEHAPAVSQKRVSVLCSRNRQGFRLLHDLDVQAEHWSGEAE